MGPLRLVLLIAAVLLAAAAGWFFWQQSRAPEAPARVEVPPAPPMPIAQPPKHPVPPSDGPLPALRESDAVLVEALAALLGSEAARKFLNLEDVVRNVVATVDNLPRRTYASRLLPVKPPAGPFRTAGKDESLAIAPANAARYEGHLRLAESVDAGRLAAAYLRFYPLFQQAYVDLGYPNGYFNDRLIEVIDHLLATPEAKEPVKLVVPKVLYEFADPELEERSAGQKALLRMGNANAVRARAFLKAFRDELLARGAKR